MVNSLSMSVQHLMRNISCYKMLAYLFQIFIPNATSPARYSSVFTVIKLIASRTKCIPLHCCEVLAEFRLW